MTAFSRAVSVAMNAGTTDGERLKSYLSAAGAGLVFHQDKTAGGRAYKAAFVGLRGIRRLIRLANRSGRPLNPAKVRAAYTEAMGREGDDEA